MNRPTPMQTVTAPGNQLIAHEFHVTEPCPSVRRAPEHRKHRSDIRDTSRAESETRHTVTQLSTGPPNADAFATTAYEYPASGEAAATPAPRSPGNGQQIHHSNLAVRPPNHRSRPDRAT